MRQFKSLKKSFGDLESGATARLIASMADLALIVEADGSIRDVSFSNDDFERYGCADWVGKRWQDVVTVESEPKVDAMLSSAKTKADKEWRQINHPMSDDQDLPIRYKVIRIKNDKPLIAIGRDMLALAVQQQKLVAAQAQIDREYARSIQTETRYQALFRFSSEAVLILNASNLEVLDANQACVNLFANGSRQLVGRRFGELLADDSHALLDALLVQARTELRTLPAELQFARNDRPLRVHIGVFRDRQRLNYLVRLADPLAVPTTEQERTDFARRDSLIEALPDGFVVLDAEQRVVSANVAFLDMAQLATAEQCIGQPIRQWLGRSGIDADILFANLHENEAISRYKMVLQGAYDGEAEVELSGVVILDGEAAYYGLIIRREQAPEINGLRMLPAGQSVEQLRGLVGRTPLRELVRQTTDVVERMCIEAALELTGDNRASAAEMLGLSRQSLYHKLRRHHLGGHSDEDLS